MTHQTIFSLQRAISLGLLLSMFLISAAKFGSADDEDKAQPPPKADPSAERQKSLEQRGYTVVPTASGEEVSPDWSPIPLETLLSTTAEQLRARATEQSFATMESAIFSATFANGDLQQGEFTGTVRKVGPASALLDWTGTNVDLHSLTVVDAPEPDDAQAPARAATWGTAPDGRAVVVIETPQTTLRGNWSARGNASKSPQGTAESGDAARTTSAGTHFSLNLPQALHSQIQLRIPSGQRVSTSAGLLTGPQPAPGNWNLWTLDLGRRHEVQITIDELPLLPAQPLLLGRLETAYSAQQNGLTIQVDVGLEVFAASVATLAIDVPADVEIQGASINNIPVPVQMDSNHTGRAVVLCGELPLEQFSLLRVNATQGPQWDRSRPLPKLIFPDIRLTQERTTLFVEAPLAVRSVALHSLVQTGLTRDGPGELWTFQSIEPGSHLIVEIGRPQADIEATIRAVVSLLPEAPAEVCQVQLRSNSGSQFAVSFRIPPGWGVLDVSGTSESTLPVTWMVDTRPDGSLLHVEFARPLATGLEKGLLILLRGEPIATNQPIPFPVLQPQIRGVVTGTSHMVTPRDLFAEPLSESSAHLHVDASDVSASLWKSLVDHNLELPQLHRASVTEFRWGTTSDPRPDRIRFVAASGMMTEDDIMLQQSARGPAASAQHGDEESPNAKSSGSIEHLRSSLDLTTVLAPRGAPSHMQRIVYEFPMQIPVSQLSLQLASSCSVSAVAINGENVTVLRRGDSISFPEQLTTVQRLEMTYIVPARRSGLWRKIDLPLPEIVGTVERFEWRIEVPAGYELSPIELPSSLSNIRASVPFYARVLGPLARGPQDGVFHPLRSDDWRSLWSPPRDADSIATPTNEVHLLALSPPAQLHLICWDKTQLRTLAWVALLAAGLTGVGIRMWNWGGLRKFSIPWLALLAAAALLVPPVTSTVFGGAFIGSLLSLLLPRRLVQQTDLLTLTGSIQPPVAAKQVALLLLGLSLLTSSSFLLAQPASTAVPVRLRFQDDGPPVCELPTALSKQLKAQELSLPAWLIRSAEYAVEFAEASPIVRADYVVHVLDSGRAQAVRLPLANVVLPNGAWCRVDGQPAQLIPAVDGSGLIVTLPALETAAAGSQPQSRLHHVEVEFSVRPDASGRLQALIPSVLDSQAIISGATSLSPLVRRGTLVADKQESPRHYLGGLTHLLWPAPTAPLSEDLATRAQSLVQVTPMQLLVTTNLTLPAGAEAMERVIQLPGQSIIRSVQGAPGTEWGLMGANPRDTLLRVTSPPQAASHTLRLEYELLPQSNGPQTVRIPPFPLLTSATVTHEMAFSTVPGWNLGVPVASGTQRIEFVPPAERNGLLQTSPGVQQCVRLAAPQYLAMPLIPVERVTTVSVVEQCHVQRSKLEWEANFQIATGPLPKFVHRLRVSPDWRIRDVKVEQMGAVQSIRWDQRGTDLTAFLDDQGQGERTLIILGSRSLPTETWIEFPKLELLDAQVQDRQLSILDETNWVVEVETNGGSVMATPAALPPPSKDRDSGAPRASQLLFRGAGATEPRRLRIVPSPDAARAETVISLQPTGGTGWRLNQMIHVQALDAPLKRVQIRIPTDLIDKVSLYPTSLRRSMSQGDDGATTLTLFVPSRMREAITFSLAFDVDEKAVTSAAIPLAEVLSAEQGPRLLVLDTTTGLRVPNESGLAISGAALPTWSPRPWSSAVRSRDAVCYQLSRAPLRMNRRENIVQDTHLPWAEHLIWLRPDGRLTGQTQLWGISHEQVILQIRLPQHVTIDAVRSETSAPVLMPLEDGSPHRRVILSDIDGLFEFTLHWHSEEPLQSIVPLPQFAPIQPANAVAGIVHGNEWEAVPVSGMQQLSPGDVWLSRWNGLLDCLDEVPTVLSIESPVMHRIRHNQQEAELYRTIKGEAYAHRYATTHDRWDNLQNELILDADSPPRRIPNHDNMGTALAMRDPAVQWFTLNQPVTSISIRPHSENSSNIALWWLLGIIVATSVTLKVLTDRFSIRERLAIRPALGVMLMGVIWWSWLFPSAFGLLLFLCGLMMLGYEFFAARELDSEVQPTA